MDPQVKMQQDQIRSEQKKVNLISNDQFSCYKHHKNFQFYCKKCGQFTCDNKRCILGHIHDGQLVLCEIDVERFKKEIKQIQKIKQRSTIRSEDLQSLNERLSSIKNINSRIFDNIRREDLLTEYLLNKQSALTEKYINDLDNFVEINERIQVDIEQMHEEINWSKVWTSLDIDLHLLNRIKHQFKQLTYLDFDLFHITENDFSRRSNIVEQSAQAYEGLMTIIFTEQGYVVGEFAANTNVDTSTLFMSSYLFVVDPLGTLRKYKHHEILISTVSIFLNEYNHSALGIRLNSNYLICNHISKETGFNGQLLVQRIKYFICTKMI